MSHEMMDLRQAARHLHIDENELRHFAQREEVPSVKRGDNFFFEHRLLDEWAQRRLYALVGEYACRPDETLLRDLKLFSSHFNVAIPYESELGKTDASR